MNRKIKDITHELVKAIEEELYNVNKDLCPRRSMETGDCYCCRECELRTMGVK